MSILGIRLKMNHLKDSVDINIVKTLRTKAKVRVHICTVYVIHSVAGATKVNYIPQPLYNIIRDTLASYYIYTMRYPADN